MNEKLILGLSSVGIFFLALSAKLTLPKGLEVFVLRTEGIGHYYNLHEKGKKV